MAMSRKRRRNKETDRCGSYFVKCQGVEESKYGTSHQFDIV